MANPRGIHVPPPPPAFGFHNVPFTKVTEGEIRAPGGRAFVVDGQNIYAPAAWMTKAEC